MTNIDNAPKLSMKNKSLLLSAKNCGCYRCLCVISTTEIVEWTDKGETAICPKCHCDCLIPEGSGIDLTNDNLTKIHKQWFD